MSAVLTRSEECASRLLALLVNKLGDPAGPVSSSALRHLHKLGIHSRLAHVYSCALLLFACIIVLLSLLTDALNSIVALAFRATPARKLFFFLEIAQFIQRPNLLSKAQYVSIIFALFLYYSSIQPLIFQSNLVFSFIVRRSSIPPSNHRITHRSRPFSPARFRALISLPYTQTVQIRKRNSYKTRLQ